jgi:PIN domain nuclease of toxin-antitoxin system
VNDVVLDASALCALLFKEKGMDRVEQLLNGALISSVNLSETAAKAIEYGTSLEEAITTLDAFPLRVVPFDRDLAYIAASLRAATWHAGLGLGDRACLALALSRKMPAVTTEGNWETVHV